MQVSDAFRAQYFLSTFEREFSNAKNVLLQLPYFSIPIENILTDFASNLLIELDQIILPAITYEIDRSKSLGLLTGNTTQARYESFFVENGKYSQQAREIVDRYPFLFQLVDSIIVQTFEALVICLQRYSKDKKAIEKWVHSSHLQIEKIQPLQNADRHRKQLAALLTFTNGLKLIYKPTDLVPDVLFKEFVTLLDLKHPFDLATLNVLPQENYGWMQYIKKEECKYRHEVDEFFCRSGVLLAIADTLHYTDGHCENLIADGPFPILIDNETLFQNYDPSIAHQKNILSTLLIQKANEEDQKSLSSALQAPYGYKRELFQTHAINDQTDDIQIRYSCISSSIHHHCPILLGKPYFAKDHIPSIVQGYTYGYDRISEKMTEILNNDTWWEIVSKVHSRVVLRETMTYSYLLRKMQTPFHASRSEVENFLKEKLGNTIYTEYEVSDLMTLNIPYFYQNPGEKHIFDGNGRKYSNVFQNTAIEVMKNQMLSRSEAKKQFDCEIIRKHLSEK